MEPLPRGVVWLLLLNSDGIPILSRAFGLEAPPLVTQGLVHGLFFAASQAGASLECVCSEVRAYCICELLHLHADCAASLIQPCRSIQMHAISKGPSGFVSPHFCVCAHRLPSKYEHLFVYT